MIGRGGQFRALQAQFEATTGQDRSTGPARVQGCGACGPKNGEPQFPVPSSLMPRKKSFDAMAAERRRASRKALDSKVEVRFETIQLLGSANNLSRSGILFFTEGELRVSVEVLEDGEKRTLTGNLVRCERIKDDHRGWAVEFDTD